MATVTLLEVGYSARSVDDHDAAVSHPPIALMPVEYLTRAAEDRTVQVQRLLAARGQHRAPSVPDLVIAAIAERARPTVLHTDKDFELIAEVTGQPTQRLA
jgi:predicted nucleic acid-binding protein